MKPSLKIASILVALFVIAQLIGLTVISQYSPHTIQVQDQNGTISNVTSYNLPFGTNPPDNTDPFWMVFQFVLSILIAVSIILLLMKLNAAIFLRIWFFIVVALALAVAFYALLPLILNFERPEFNILSSLSIISLALGLILSYIKVYRRNILLHNITEVIIYPGLAAIFVPVLDVGSTILLLILISGYDIYAVWHSGFMQKMAKYQIKELRFFAGIFVPYLGKKEQAQIKATKGKVSKKVKVNVAILGGGDIVFPLILAGVVLFSAGLVQALIVSLGATLGLVSLLYLAERGKFYPAMPFITVGCFIALLINQVLF